MKERVKELCKIKGISMNLAEIEIGLAKGYISKLDKINPNTKTLQKIADYFGVSLEYLTTGKDNDFDKYGAESAHLVAKIRNDAGLTQALEKYFELSDKKKKHVIELISLLSEG